MKDSTTTNLLKSLFVIFFGLLNPYNVCAQNIEKQSNTGIIDFNGYYDSRDFSVVTINILAKLPNRLQYFSFTNYQSTNPTFDLSSFYAEHNLRWQIKNESPFDLTYQFVMRQGSGNDDSQLGIRWRINNTAKFSALFNKLNLSYSINPMIIRLRGGIQISYISQIEHVYKIKLYKDRVYLEGFTDQNFINLDGKLTQKWVNETQIGVRIMDQLYAVVEYRFNDFLTSKNKGLGYGIEYKILF